jgi:hypothetical protein
MGLAVRPDGDPQVRRGAGRRRSSEGEREDCEQDGDAAGHDD